jgi:hypothetical protein
MRKRSGSDGISSGWNNGMHKKGCGGGRRFRNRKSKRFGARTKKNRPGIALKVGGKAGADDISSATALESGFMQCIEVVADEGGSAGSAGARFTQGSEVDRIAEGDDFDTTTLCGV